MGHQKGMWRVAYRRGNSSKLQAVARHCRLIVLLAQLVEQHTMNVSVGGSTPSQGIT